MENILFCLKLQEMLWLNQGGWFPIIHNCRQTQRKFSQPPLNHPVSQTSRCIHPRRSGSWKVVLVSNEHCSFKSIHIMWSHFNLPFCQRSKMGIVVIEVTFTNINCIEINEETDCLTQMGFNVHFVKWEPHRRPTAPTPHSQSRDQNDLHFLFLHISLCTCLKRFLS